MCQVLYYYPVHYLLSGVFIVFQGQKTNLSLLLSCLDQQVFDLLSENKHILVSSLLYIYILFV